MPRPLSVSIPTLLKSRVQRTRGASLVNQWRQFQSPPCSKAECNGTGPREQLALRPVSIPTLLKSRVQQSVPDGLTYVIDEFQSPPCSKAECNPSRARRACSGATGFNPHPAQEQSATILGAYARVKRNRVSIPTLLKSRVQRAYRSKSSQEISFQSPPCSRAECNGTEDFIFHSSQGVSIPTLLKSRVQPGFRRASASPHR